MIGSAELMAMAPILVLGLGATLVMLQIAIHRSAVLTRYSSLLVLVLAGIAANWPELDGRQSITPLLQADSLSLMFSTLFCAVAAVCVMLSRDYLPRLSDQSDEYYLLILLATLGSVILVYASHAAALLLGLELLSVSLYALIAYPSRVPVATEAATKYLVLSGGASATILFGFALLYAASGSLAFVPMGAGLAVSELGGSITALAGVLIVSGVCFKLSAAPFHFWTPDVYEGSPAPITALLATVAKAAPFIAMLRLFVDAQLFDISALIEVLAILAVLSMVVGNLLALLQENIKRVLAYSSIAHIGYALVIFVVAQDPGNRAFAAEAGIFFFCAYLPTTVAAFGVLALLNPGGEGEDEAQVNSLSGLFWREPLLALLMLVALLSLAGIPLTAGFIGKFYLFAAAVAGAHWVLLGALVLGSAIGIYYYLRIIFQMSQKPVDSPIAIQISISDRAMVLLLIGAIVALGIVPQALMAHIRTMF